MPELGVNGILFDAGAAGFPVVLLLVMELELEFICGVVVVFALALVMVVELLKLGKEYRMLSSILWPARPAIVMAAEEWGSSR